MRKLHDHEINTFNAEHVGVLVMDDPDPNAGGACHSYGIEVIDKGGRIYDVHLKFQHGPVKETGVNGITDQALIAIVLDRYRAFQLSKWANRETALSITHLEEALMWQHKRTLDRERRDVEGTNKL